MTVTMPIHEIKDHLSSVIAALIETGEEVEITKHGRVVARLVPAGGPGVVLGLGARARAGAGVPDVDDLRWTDAEVSEFVDNATMPT